MNDIDRYRSLLRDTEAQLVERRDDHEALVETCLHIQSDLTSTMPEYVETTGEQPHAYYGWRRRAKTALFHKQREVATAEKHIKKLSLEVERLRMFIKAMESGYRGEDSDQLLRAMFHFVNDIVSATNYAVDEEQQGLLASVSHRLGNLEVVSANSA